MQRTKGYRKPNAILTSDWHLREDTPTCWTGDFQNEQWNSVDFVSDLREKCDCTVINAGDLFDHWKPSPWLLSMAIQHLPEVFYSVYGQHDLPQHNMHLMSKCGLHTLDWAGIVHVLPEAHYGQTPGKGSLFFPTTPGRSTLVWHHLTYITPPFPGAKEGQAMGILKKYPQFDLIVTGDNHQSFSEEYEGRLLVNPGPLTRQEADQMDYQPRVALWYAEDNTIEWVDIPIQKDVMTREYIDVKKAKDARMEAYISRLDDNWEVGVKFEDNLKAFYAKNETKQSIKIIITKAIE